MAEISTPPPPLKPFFRRAGSGAPFFSGSRCRKCGHVYVGERGTCARCTAREAMEPCRLAERREAYVHTVVHRSFPGVAKPFVDAIVNRHDGAYLKGTLLWVKLEAGARQVEGAHRPDPRRRRGPRDGARVRRPRPGKGMSR